MKVAKFIRMSCLSTWANLIGAVKSIKVDNKYDHVENKEKNTNANTSSVDFLGIDRGSLGICISASSKF